MHVGQSGDFSGQKHVTVRHLFHLVIPLQFGVKKSNLQFRAYSSSRDPCWHSFWSTLWIIDTYFEPSFFSQHFQCKSPKGNLLPSLDDTNLPNWHRHDMFAGKSKRCTEQHFFSLWITGKGGKLRPSDRKWKIGGGDVRPSTSSGKLERWYSLQDFHLILILDMFWCV